MSTADDQGQTDGPPDSPSGDGALESGTAGYGPPREDEVSLLDILLVLARHKTLIVRTVLIFAVLGTTYAVFAPEQYTSTTKVVREGKSKGGGSLPGGLPSLRGLGINLGGATSGITPAAYPEILTSRAVQLAVARDTFFFPGVDRQMTFVQYVNRPPSLLDRVLAYTLKLPWTLKGMFGKAISGSSRRSVGEKNNGGTPVYPTENEERAMDKVSDMVSPSTDPETGIMSISVTAGSPALAASVAQRFRHHMTERVRTLRTERTRRNLRFIEERFGEAEQELEQAEDRLAKFLERNQQVNSATLRFQRDRIQRQVQFKEELYSELQSQRTQARINLKKRQPVVTVVEEAVPPMSRSAPRRTLLVLLSALLGGILGVASAFGKSYLESTEGKDEGKKIEEIREKVMREGIVGRVRSRLES